MNFYVTSFDSIRFAKVKACKFMPNNDAISDLLAKK